jgi:uncharacterized Zn finger protein
MNGLTEESIRLEGLLSPLDRGVLQTLLLHLVHNRPDLVAEIEVEIAKLPVPAYASVFPVVETPVASLPPFPVAPTLIRKQVRRALKAVTGNRYDDYWDDDGSERLVELEGEITPFIAIADALIEAGNGRSALPTLEATTDELTEGWDLVEDIVGEADELIDDLGRAWAEAILTAELTSQERAVWVERLEAWADTAGFRGLEVAAEAARQGWDYPPLMRVLQGEITEKGAWEEEAADCADELAVARLNVLERQGRWQEAAYLAEAESQDDRYLAALIRLGRAQEAVEIGMTLLLSVDSALALATTLHQNGQTALAFRTAEHGLTLPGPQYTLATWLRDSALTAGDTERAIYAARIAIYESPNLSDYTQLQQIAGEQWPQLREKILTHLRTLRPFDVSGKVNIFLQEGLQQEALYAVQGSWNYDLVIRVVETVTPSLPLQVIPLCMEQAARIMDAGKADRYDYAARWVERARNAFRVAGQESQWQDYKTGLLATHHRKYKLIPMLRNL